VLVTPDELESREDWAALVEHARRSTRLLPGDVIAAGGIRDGPHRAGDVVELELPGIGVLRNYVAAAS
jgi:2-keto-4-pentenoate hydratase/2-oxohepta-3-ene-1,7-dioic acid hydratase in catechol pathway